MENKKHLASTFALTLSIVASIVLLLCILLPIFSFWNYRLYMITLLPTLLFTLLAVIKDNKRRNIIGGILIIVSSAICFCLSGVLTSTFILIVLNIIIAVILFLLGKPSIFNNKKFNTAMIIVVFITTFYLQANTISRIFDNYDAASSGLFDVPDYVADSMLTFAFNEIGMLIAIICVLLCLIAISIKSTLCLEQPFSGEGNEELQTEEVVDEVRATESDVEHPAQEENQIGCITTNFCRKCGVKLSSDSLFCSNCGTKVETTIQ